MGREPPTEALYPILRTILSSWIGNDRNLLSVLGRRFRRGSTSGEGPFSLSEPGKLEALLEQADLKVVGSGEVDVPLTYPDIETFWRAQRSAGPLQGAIRVAGEERVRQAVQTAAETYRKPDGSPGESQNHLRVYGNPDKPCPVCGGPIVKIWVGQRGTHFCPTCQPADPVHTMYSAT